MKLEYRILRSRRKTIAIQITPAGEVLVRCPARMTTQQIHQFVESKRSWLLTHLKEAEQRKAIVPLTEEELQALAREAKQRIPEKVARYAEIIGVSYGRITIRSQHTRWGSCSGKGNLNFNCLLMLAPEAVLDYVIVHELCHRKQMNHSPKFWAEVAAVLPGYAARKQWLKENGAALLAKLPQN